MFLQGFIFLPPLRLVPVPQRFTQRSGCLKKMAFHGSFGRTQDLSNLTYAHAVEYLELESETLFIGKGRQDLADLTFQLFAAQNGEGIQIFPGSVPDFLRKLSFSPLPGTPEKNPIHETSSPNGVQAGIRDNSVEPCIEGGIAPKSPDVFERAQEGLLRQIPRLFTISGTHMIGDVIGLLMITANQLLSGPIVPLTGARRQLFIFYQWGRYFLSDLLPVHGKTICRAMM